MSWTSYFTAVLALVSISCASWGQGSSSDRQFSVNVQLSIDYEGEVQPKQVFSANIAEVQRVLSELSRYVFIHLVNPAYFTAPHLDGKQIAQDIHRLVKPHHEVGLHIHPIDHLIESVDRNYEKTFGEKSVVEFRMTPSFWADRSVPRGGHYGDDVPFNSYSTKQLDQIIRYSLHVLKQFGFRGLQSFRANGWTSGKNVFPALVKNGIRVETSALPPGVVKELYEGSNLDRMAQENWSGLSNKTQPFRMSVKGGGVLEVHVNTLGLSDYLSAEKAFEQYQEIVRDAKAQGMRAVTIHYGLHLESASVMMKGSTAVTTDFGQRVIDFIRLVEAHAAKENILLNPVGFEKFPKAEVRPKAPEVFRCLRAG